MSYSNPTVVTHNLPLVDLGDGATPATAEIIAPPGFTVGRLIDMGIAVTETFACDATPAKVEIGDGTDADEYAAMNIPDATAAPNTFSIVDDTDAIIESTILVSDLTSRAVVVTYTAGVDAATEAGIGSVYATIAWS